MKKFFVFGILFLCSIFGYSQELDLLNENFDDVVLGIPDGWDNSDNTLSNTMYNWQYYAPGYGGDGKCMRFNSYTTGLGESSALKTPVMELNRESMLSFKFKNADAGDFSVYLSVDGGVTYTNVIEKNLRSVEWVEREYSLAAYTGEKNVVVVFVGTSNAGSGDAFVYIDDVVVEDIPLCAMPKELTRLSASDTSAILTWNVSAIGGEIINYRLHITDNRLQVTNTIEFEAEDFIYELMGLTPNTEYEVVLEGYCGLGKGWSDVSEPLVFRTMCSGVSVPMVETFDGVQNGMLPECFSAENAQVCSDLGGSQLRMTSNTTSGAMLVTPKLMHAANDLDVKMKVYGAKGTKFMVGVMSDATQAETFEVLWEDSIRENNVWYDYHRPTVLSNVYGADDNVSLALSLPSGVVATMYVDSIEVVDAAECMYLYDLHFVTATATSVMIDWSEYVVAEGYEYEIREKGKDNKEQGIGNREQGWLVIGNLLPSTEYEVRVRSVCGTDRGEWTDWVGVKTVCAPREDAVFVESFAKGGVPQCWMVKQTVGVDRTGNLNRGDEGWSTTTTPSNVYSGTAALWGRKAYKGIHTIVVSQAIDIERAGMYDMRFWLKRLDINKSDVLQVWVNNRPDTVAGVKLGIIHNSIKDEPQESTSGWYKYEYNIPLSGVTYIIFEMIANESNQFYIDDVEVFLAPTCRKVKDVKWIGETTKSGIMGWSKAAEEDAWIVSAQYAIDGGKQYSVRDTVTGEPKWELDGLMSATDYRVSGYVMAYCGGNDKGDSVAFEYNFRTKCEAIEEFPFIEGFEGELFPPKCWEQWQIASPDVVDSTRQGWGRNTNLTSFVHRGAASAQLYNFGEGYKHLLVMPQMDFGEGGYRLTFWQYRHSGYSIKQLEGVRVLINDVPSTEGAEELIYIKSNMLMYPEVYEAGWYKYKVDIQATGKKYIMFEGVSENYQSSFIDDIEIAKIPECDEIGEFAVIDVLDTKISVKTAANTTWQVSCVAGNMEAEEGIIANGTDSVVEVTGLESATTYRLYARRVCGDKYGAWSEELVEVTTLCSPIVVNVENEWFEGFEDCIVGGGISSCYIQERGTTMSRELKVMSSYDETDVYGELVMYTIHPKTGSRFALTPEYNSDNWMFAYVDLLAGENYELSVMARHGDMKTNISTKVSLAYGSRPMIDSMTTYILEDYVVDGDWTQVAGSFRVAESGKYFVGIHLQVNDYYEKGAIDDIRLRVSNCVNPSLMSASRTTQNSVQLHVVSLSDSIRIAVSDRVFNPVSEQANIYDATVVVSGTQYNITGLQPDTKYYYSVCGVCGEYASDWMRLDSFETRCLAVDVPLFEGFESNENFGCWSVIGNGLGEIVNNESYSDNCSYKANGVTFITPMLNVESLEEYMLTGYVYAIDKNVAFAVGVMNDPNDIETFETVTTFTVHNRTTWTEFFSFFKLLEQADFEAYREAKYLAIVVPNDVDFYFDDLRIDLAVDCPNPTEPVITNITTTSCDISWVSNGEEKEWRIVGVGQHSIDTVVNSCSVTIGGLQPSMYYDFYVTALCSDIESSVTSYVGGMRTLCRDVMPLPYSETMEGAEYVSDLCFSYINKKAEYPAVEFDRALFVMGGKQSLELIMSATEPLCVIMPEFELPTNQLRMSFDYRNETADTRWNTDLVLGVIRDINDINTFDTLRVCPMNDDSTRVYYYFDSLPAELANARIALKYGPGPIDNRSCGIDNILIEAIPGCVEPAKEMEIVALTDTSVTIKFDGRGATKWEYSIKEQGTENNEQGTILNSQFSILNLLPRTTYDVYIRSVCSENKKSDWVGPLSFRTNCKDGLETPWIETFEDYTDISEGCFITIGEEGNTNISLSGGKYANKGDKGMLMSLGQYKELYVILPRFEAPISDLKLVFDYYSEEHDGVTGDLILGVMSDITDRLTFKQIMAYGTTNGYVTQYHTFGDIDEEYENGWIVFKWCNFRQEWSYGPTYYAYCGLDNIKVESGASCFEPEGFDLVGVSDNSAEVVWSHLEEIENAEYRLTIADGEEEVATGRVDTMRVELVDLQAGTNYVLSVRTLCNDTTYSDWVDFEFRTVAASPSLPYVVGFEDEEENANWTLVNGDQMNKLIIGSDEEAVSSGDKSLYISHDGTDYFYYFNYASDVHAYRPIYLESGEYLSEFSWKCAGEDTRDYGRLYLVPVTRKINAGEYIAAQAYVPEGCIAIDGGIHLNESEEWRRKTVEFSVKESQFYNLVVSWHNNNSGGATPPFAIDDIVIREATCLPVDSLHIVAIDDRSAIIGFNDEGLGMRSVEWGIKDKASNVFDFQFSIINSQLLIQNLESETEYEFRVRVVCGEGDTSQWRSIEFKTEKMAVTAPYATGFEDAKDNAGWTIVNRGNNAFIVGSSDEGVSSGDSALYVHSTQDSYAVSYNYVKNAGYTYDTQNIYAYRLIRFEPGSYYIDYDWKCEGKENEDFGRVYLQITDDRLQITDEAVLLDEGPLYGSLEWGRKGGVLLVEDTTIYKLVVMWQNEVDGTYYTGPKPLAIDNIKVEKLDCGVVDSIKLVVLGDTYAEVEFKNNSQKTSYRLREIGQEVDVRQGEVEGSGLIFEDLKSNTQYTLSLKSICENGTESPERVLTFTTTKYQHSLPYETGFEEDEDNNRWMFVNSIGSNKFVINSDRNAVNRGDRALYVSSGDSVYNYVDYTRNVMAYVSLTFDEPGEYVISYDWKAKGELGSDYARVFLAPTTCKLVEDTHYPYETLRDDFIAVDGGKGLSFDTAIWHNQTEVFEADRGNYNFVVAWHNDQYINGTPPIAIDNIVVRRNSCKAVEAIELVEVKDVEATVRIKAENVSVVEYRVSLTRNPDDAFISDVTSGDMIYLAGLKPNAIQYLYVRIKCSDVDYSLWQMAEIETYCDEIIEVTKTKPYIDNFEYTDLDPCWIVTKGGRATGAISMLASLETTVLKATNDVDVRLTRPFNLVAGKRYELSIKSRQRELLEDARIGFVAGCRDDEFDTLAQYQVTQAYEYYDATFTPSETGLYELGVWVFTPWWCNNSTTYLLTVDEFEVKEVLLAKPEAFAVDYLSSNQVDLSWKGDGLADSYGVQLLINGSVVRDTIVVEESVSFAGLKNSTLYDARVRGLLTQAGDSSSWATLSFRTHCDVAALPFRENFEELNGDIPTCWTLASNLTEETRDWAVKEDMNGNKAMQVSTSLANGYAVLHTPLLFVDSDIYSLKFRYETNISDDEYLVVTISDDAGFTFADTVIYAIKNNAWTDVEYDLSGYVGKTIMVEFKVRSLRDNSYSETVSIDDVKIVCRSANEIVYTDHICWGKRYRGYGFDVDTERLKFGLNRIEELKESQVEGECDTMKVLNLIVDPAGTFYLNDTICPGDVYNKGAFAGYNLTESGTYLSEPQVSSCGCDSTIRLYLVVQAKREIINDTICEGDVYEFAGREISVTGIYVDTISYCEFRTLNLVVHPKYFEHGDTICEGTILDWEGMQLSETGRYEKAYRNKYGCDSIEVMNLWVIPKQVDLSATICQGTTYYFGGVERSEAGVYVDSLVNILGCDSIITLHLSVSEPSRSRFEDYVCEGYEYVGYGFKVFGITADTLLERATSTLAGCDSVVEVFVKFVPTIEVDTIVTIVDGEFYEFGERTLTKAGLYTETFITQGTSCDSIVNLTLVVETGLEGVYALPLVVAPNPIRGGESTYVNRNWTLEEQRGLRVEVIDARGEVVMSYIPDNYPIEIVGLGTRGIYMIRIVSGIGDVYVGKLVVN